MIIEMLTKMENKKEKHVETHWNDRISDVGQRA